MDERLRNMAIAALDAAVEKRLRSFNPYIAREKIAMGMQVSAPPPPPNLGKSKVSEEPNYGEKLRDYNRKEKARTWRVVPADREGTWRVVEGKDAED